MSRAAPTLTPATTQTVGLTPLLLPSLVTALLLLGGWAVIWSGRELSTAAVLPPPTPPLLPPPPSVTTATWGGGPSGQALA